MNRDLLWSSSQSLSIALVSNCTWMVVLHREPLRRAPMLVSCQYAARVPGAMLLPPYKHPSAWQLEQKWLIGSIQAYMRLTAFMQANHDRVCMLPRSIHVTALPDTCTSCRARVRLLLLQGMQPCDTACGTQPRTDHLAVDEAIGTCTKTATVGTSCRSSARKPRWSLSEAMPTTRPTGSPGNTCCTVRQKAAAAAGVCAPSSTAQGCCPVRSLATWSAEPHALCCMRLAMQVRRQPRSEDVCSPWCVLNVTRSSRPPAQALDCCMHGGRSTWKRPGR